MIIGFLYGVIFSVSHVNSSSKFSDDEKRFEQIQLGETADWAAGSMLCNYLTGGLNHQVVHHLYPRISSFYYPEMSSKLIDHWGEEYHRYDGLWSIMRSNFEYMRKMGCANINDNGCE